MDAGRGPNSTPSGTESEVQQTAIATERHPVVVAFSEQGDGRSALECLVRLAVVALTCWPGEKSLLVIPNFFLLVKGGYYGS